MSQKALYGYLLVLLLIYQVTWVHAAETPDAKIVTSGANPLSDKIIGNLSSTGTMNCKCDDGSTKTVPKPESEPPVTSGKTDAAEKPHPTETPTTTSGGITVHTHLAYHATAILIGLSSLFL
ncbi:hypothetical protein BY996DRAFT_6420387 [Phakopsora pachyrhizi]|uniref:Expressed protein n=1 Tax=Phakopsora pachyrhizi TaxID=170000 RepID=A0AAV0AFP7_PHAPC|nr:hypothetical protein BY996DRAFT_6420387 [Phakopsora pachyrhizi]CAH7666252.1 expressed protein [Phakopsora pachyrhizi]